MDLSKNEFFCPECDACFTFFLPMTLNQNYRIHCPMCGHMHYRKLENGIITDIRITENLEEHLIADIFPMKSSCKEKLNETDKDSYYYEKPAEGFIHRLWKEFSGY